MEDKRIVSTVVLDEAEQSTVALMNLLNYTILPMFGDWMLAGFLNNATMKGTRKEAAALEWMEQHFDALYGGCYAAAALADRVVDILQMEPQEYGNMEPDRMR